MDDFIRPYTYVAFRLPSNAIKVLEILPNTNISLGGKYGTFPSKLLIGRPFYVTFEVQESEGQTSLRIVPPQELYEHIKSEEASQGSSTPQSGDHVDDFEIVNPEGKVVMRSNQNTYDDNKAQKLTMADIEELKKADTGSGKDIIAKILESHSALDQKTTFALAKYTLRKTMKYIKRFTPLPLDVPRLTSWLVNEKDPSRIMEMREEMLSLVMSWSNVHHVGPQPEVEGTDQEDRNRYLVVDEVGGLLVASLAERMGILYPDYDKPKDATPTKENSEIQADEADSKPKDPTNLNSSEAPVTPTSQTQPSEPPSDNPSAPTQKRTHPNPMSARNNTLTVIHANTQPNLSLLNYFSFNSATPTPSHPLFYHLKTLTWLQLLHPSEDTVYREPPEISPDELATWKPGRRGNYHRKRRRWERTKAVIDETRAGQFNGLIVASVMNPMQILHHLVPLLRGGAQVVVYSPTVERITELADCYSKARRTAFLLEANAESSGELASRAEPKGEAQANIKTSNQEPADLNDIEVPSQAEPTKPTKPPTGTEDFPVDPTLLLTPQIFTARARPWQVLPGRTHPLMRGRGGAEGYIFVATRVLPLEGVVNARGAQQKRRKREGDDDVKVGGRKGKGVERVEQVGKGETQGVEKSEEVLDEDIEMTGVDGS